jgi:hypothetical protein
VAHTCNPSYSGGRDQEDHGSKSALSNWFGKAYLGKKKKSQKRAGRMSQAVKPPVYQAGSPEFKTRCHHKKKKNQLGMRSPQGL